jgi:WD40 repeat protein
MTESTADQIAEYRSALAAFASGLRALYDASSFASLGELSSTSRKTGRRALSPAGISDALNGKRLPSMDYTLELVRLLASPGGNAGAEAQRQWRDQWQAVKKLQRASRSAEKEISAIRDQEASDLGELREQRDRMSQNVERLSAYVKRLNEEITGLGNKVTAAEARAGHLQAALYGLWPADGVRLEASYGAGSLAFSPDGRVLAVGYGNGMLRTWDPDSAELLGGSLAGHAGRVNSVAYEPSGLALAVGSDDGTLRIADPRTSQLQGRPVVSDGPAILALAFSRPEYWGRWLAAGDRTGHVRIWRVPNAGWLITGNVRASRMLTVGGPVRALAFAPSGRTLAVGTENGRVSVWNATTWDRGIGPDDTENVLRPIQEFRTDPVRSLCFREGDHVVAVGGDADAFELWTLASSTARRAAREGQDAINVGFPVRSLASSPISPLLAIGGTRGIMLWQPGSRTIPMLETDDPVQSVAFRPDGKLLAAGLESGTTIMRTVVRDG